MMTRIHCSPDTTSTFQSTVFPQPVTEVSLFRDHQLKPTGPGIDHLRNAHPDWVLGVLMACIILIAWTRVFYHKRLQQVLRAPFSRRFINQLVRDGNLFRERISVALGIVYILAFALMLYEINELRVGITFRGISPVTLYLLIILGIVAGSTVKVTLVQLLGVIFKTRETTYNYLLNFLIFALLNGPVLLVTMILVVYLRSEMILYAGMAVFLFLFIFRFIRGFFIGLALTKFSYLFLFVYLCSLEILPFLVLLKFMLNYVHPKGL